MPSVYKSFIDGAVTVSYPTSEAEQKITSAEYELIKSVYEAPQGNKVQMIKFVRGQYNLGLAEAKRICDTIGAQPKPHLI